MPENSVPAVSLLVCTYNRVHVLGQTLASLLRQQFGGDFEIVVVDNASTDGTRQLVEKLAAAEPRLRYLHEPRLGVAIARNSGARAAQADYIAYFDDDLLAAPDCLAQLMAPFSSASPAPLAVMGRVKLSWQGQRPAWFPPRYESLLSAFDLGSAPRFLRPDEYLITMNVAFKRAEFLSAGGIREDLSRRGRMLICSGDNEIFRRYMLMGWPIYYQPSAQVWHLVPRARQARTWLLKRLFGEGTSQVLVDYAGAGRATVARRAAYDLKQTGLVPLRALQRDGVTDLYSMARQLGRLSAEAQLLAGVANVRTVSE